MRITGRFAEMLHHIYHMSYSSSCVLLPVTVFSSLHSQSSPLLSHGDVS